MSDMTDKAAMILEYLDRIDKSVRKSAFDQAPGMRIEEVPARWISLETWTGRVSEADFLAFGERILSRKLAGFRLVRETRSDGFPAYYGEGVAAA